MSARIWISISELLQILIAASLAIWLVLIGDQGGWSHLLFYVGIAILFVFAWYTQERGDSEAEARIDATDQQPSSQPSS